MNTLDHTSGSLELALEPRMMFDAAAVATVAEVAADAEAQADAPVSADAATGGISVDAQGKPTGSADLFTNVQVDAPSGEGYDKLTLTVTASGGAYALTVGGKDLLLTSGNTVEFDSGNSLSAKVESAGSGKCTVTIDLAGLDAAGVQSLIDGLALKVTDGTAVGAGSISASLDAVSTLDGTKTDLGLSRTIEVTTSYNQAPEVDFAGGLNAYVDTALSGIESVVETTYSDDRSIVFVGDVDGDVAVLKLVNGKYQQVSLLDHSTVEGLGSIWEMAASKDGKVLYVGSGDKIFRFSYEAASNALKLDASTSAIGSSGDFETSASGDVLITQARIVSEFYTSNSFQIYHWKDGALQRSELSENAYMDFARYGDYFIRIRNSGSFPYPPQVAILDGEGNVVFSVDYDAWAYEPASDVRVTVAGDVAAFEFGDVIKIFKIDATNKTMAQVAEMEVSDFSDFALSPNADRLFITTKDGSITQYAFDGKETITQVGVTEKLSAGAKVVAWTDSGALVASGTGIWNLTSNIQGTWGSSVNFGKDLNLSDVELDLKDDYGGASFTVVSTNNGGSFSFSAEGFSQSRSEITKDGKVVASFTAGNGRLTVTFAEGTSAADADAVLHGWSFNFPTTGSSSFTLTVTASDGTRESEALSFDISLAGNQAPSAEASGTDASYDTAGTEQNVFGTVTVSPGESGQLITDVVISVTGAGSADAGERLVIDGAKISLKTSSSGTTTSGAVYKYVVNADGTGVLSISYGKGSDSASVGKMLSSITYVNESVAGKTTLGLTGERVFSITSVKDAGGTLEGGVDAVDPKISVTVKLALNSTPTIGVEGGEDSSIFDADGILDGTENAFTNSITYSPDGKTVLVVGTSGGNANSGATSIYVYSRDVDTGEMKLLQTLTDGATLNRISATTFSADGKYAYVAAYSDNAAEYSILLYSRAEDGTLTLVGETAKQGVGSVDGLNGWVSSLHVSEDGKTLYPQLPAQNDSQARRHKKIFNIHPFSLAITQIFR